MIRLFVGIALPENVIERLHRLSGGVPGARWLAPENLHLTLRFIGNVEETAIADIDDGLARVRAPAFDMEIAGVGHFSRGRRPVMLWAGVVGHPALLDLYRRIDGALVKAGFPPEGRRYTPHVTLARVRDGTAARVRAFEAENNLLRIDPLPVSDFILFSSHLGHREANYRAEISYPLEDREKAGT